MVKPKLYDTPLLSHSLKDSNVSPKMKAEEERIKDVL
jgi:hypothetical protein